MAWSNVGNLKGPKGDAGEASGSIQQGTMVFAYASSPAAKAMLASKEWKSFGELPIYVDKSTGELNLFSSPNATKSSLYVFMKA